MPLVDRHQFRVSITVAAALPNHSRTVRQLASRDTRSVWTYSNGEMHAGLYLARGLLKLKARPSVSWYKHFFLEFIISRTILVSTKLMEENNSNIYHVK